MASPHTCFASIDVGSHTLRLLIARCNEKGEVFPLHTERRITRLARSFQKNARLEAHGVEESLKVLDEYAALLKQYGVESAACGATGVVRRAINGDAFLQTVRQRTGIPAAILSEDSEAWLSAKGVLSILPHPEGYILSFDLGGSSTEFLLLHALDPQPIWHTSVFIGAATLTERFLGDDPPAPASVTQAAAAIEEALAPVFQTVQSLLHHEANSPEAGKEPFSPSLHVVGTAGTATTLAAMQLQMQEYDPQRINGLAVTERWLSEMTERLLRSPLALRRQIPGLETDREDIIAAGALIVTEILKGLRRPQFTVSDAGLLEGILLNLIEKEYGRPEALVSPLTWGMQTVKGLTKAKL